MLTVSVTKMIFHSLKLLVLVGGAGIDGIRGCEVKGSSYFPYFFNASMVACCGTYSSSTDIFPNILLSVLGLMFTLASRIISRFKSTKSLCFHVAASPRSNRVSQYLIILFSLSPLVIKTKICYMGNTPVRTHLKYYEMYIIHYRMPQDD